jgi:hypothetical protein
MLETMLAILVASFAATALTVFWKETLAMLGVTAFGILIVAVVVAVGAVLLGFFGDTAQLFSVTLLLLLPIVSVIKDWIEIKRT